VTGGSARTRRDKRIHHDGRLQPEFPGEDVRDVARPDPVARGDLERAIQHVRDAGVGQSAGMLAGAARASLSGNKSSGGKLGIDPLKGHVINPVRED
jgi:hypothetical protein